MSKSEHSASQKFAILQEIECGHISVKAATKKIQYFKKRPWQNGGVVMRFMGIKG